MGSNYSASDYINSDMQDLFAAIREMRSDIESLKDRRIMKSDLEDAFRRGYEHGREEMATELESEYCKFFNPDHNFCMFCGKELPEKFTNEKETDNG